MGVTPARTTINFEPNLQQEITIRALNNEHKDFKAVIFTRGNLSIELLNKDISFAKNEEYKEIKYKVTLPAKLEPGVTTGDVVIREVKPLQQEGEITIGALVSVVSQLYVIVPYPGKYARAELIISEAQKDEQVSFLIPVYNLGSKKIDKASAIIDIYDINNKKVASVPTDEKSIDSFSKRELVASWAANVDDGTYNVIATVNYDNSKIELNGKFIVGNFLIKPIDISVNNFRLGQVAKFNILVENIGNYVIKDAYSEITLNKQAQPIADVKSSPTEIPPKAQKELIAYWDTENIEQGEYQGKLTLGYADKKAERQIRTEVGSDYIKTEIIGVTGLVIAPLKISNKQISMAVIIMILILLNIIWFVLYTKKKNKQEQQPK
ncbi:MAG: hypothetical protein NT139_02465 [Candidatus Woesearchaeota archaeon]|nr:hypothetical protein [Candidatus Woesearchaeota archaeon]